MRIDEPSVINFVTALWGHASGDTRLFGMSSGSFRTRWNAVAVAVGFDPTSLRDAVTPACLRGSGATALYRATADVRRVQWQGRWSRAQTLEAYIQEAASSQALLKVPESSRARIIELSNYMPSLLSLAIVTLTTANLGEAPARPAQMPKRK